MLILDTLKTCYVKDEMKCLSKIRGGGPGVLERKLPCRLFLAFSFPSLSLFSVFSGCETSFVGSSALGVFFRSSGAVMDRVIARADRDGSSATEVAYPTSMAEEES